MEFNRILIVKLSSLGDVIHSLPFLAALRRKYPRAKIVWAAQPEFSHLIPGPPWVDEIVEFPRPSLKRPFRTLANLIRLRRRLLAENFDLSIDLQGLFKSALVVALSGSRKRLGVAFMREGSYFISRRVRGAHADGHAVERNLDVARFLGADVDKVEYPFPNLSEHEQKVVAKLNAFGDLTSFPYIVLAPGTRWPTKCWPASHFAELAARLLNDGWRVILAGAPGDREIMERIVAAVPRDVAAERLIDFVGQTSLQELAALIKNSSLFVSGDTGPLHIAAALQVPIVAVFGPTLPDRTGPYGNERALILTTPLACGGCLKKSCDSFQCLSSITSEKVYNACLQALSLAER